MKQSGAVKKEEGKLVGVKWKTTLERAWNKFYVTRIAPLREKSFPIESPDVIHYLFFPKKKSKVLVVVLQAFHPEGARYNYVSTLQGINASRLYIKDDFTPHTGSFYLGRNGTYNIEAGVHRLIRQIAEQCQAEKLIFVGSSKGGAAAVNFGIAYPGAAMIVAASLIVVPLLVAEDKLFWTFCAFTASLLLLLGVACVYTHGDWFWISASGVLFGLSLVFLPFLVRADPVKKLIGDSNRLMIILGVDVALFFNLLNAIDSRGKFTLNRVFFTVGVFAAIIGVVAAIIRNRKHEE